MQWAPILYTEFQEGVGRVEICCKILLSLSDDAKFKLIPVPYRTETPIAPTNDLINTFS